MLATARIPEKYVVVAGVGQSDFGPGLDPWETTAFDLALLDAGIGNYNIVKYSSVLPPEAKEISLNEAKEAGLLHHGMVLESIMAQVNGRKGEHLCAGIGTIEVYQRKNGEAHLIGGFAAEYEGHQSPEAVKKILGESLCGIFDRRYGGNSAYFISGFHYYLKNLVVDCDFGTVLVALGFVSFAVKDSCGCSCLKIPSQSGDTVIQNSDSGSDRDDSSEDRPYSLGDEDD